MTTSRLNLSIDVAANWREGVKGMELHVETYLVLESGFRVQIDQEVRSRYDSCTSEQAKADAIERVTKAFAELIKQHMPT